MSNPHDDPGHRPPPPRQGEPPPYQDGPQPYRDGPQPYQDGPQPYRDGPQPYQDGTPPYQDGPQPYRDGTVPDQDGPLPYHDGPPPPPGQQLPPGAYRPGPSAYGPPSQPPHGPSVHPSRAGKGFFAALFDTNFDHMITVHLARKVYTVLMIMISLFALVVLWYGLSFFQWNSTLAIMTILAAPLIWIFDVVLVRVFMEFVINQFKITEHLKAMRERDGLR